MEAVRRVFASAVRCVLDEFASVPLLDRVLTDGRETCARSGFARTLASERGPDALCPRWGKAYGDDVGPCGGKGGLGEARGRHRGIVGEGVRCCKLLQGTAGCLTHPPPRW